MNILIAAVSRSTRPSGICRHAANLARSLALQAETNRITLVVAPWQKPYFEEAFCLHLPKIDIIAADVRSHPIARNRWYRNTLPSLAAALQADIIHLSYPVPVRRGAFRSPVIVTLHDLYPYDEPKNFGYPQVFANRFILRQCLGHADAVTCVSEATYRGLAQRIPAAGKRASIIPNSVEIGTNSAGGSPFTPSQHAHFLLCVAQHRANKNLALLFRSFVRLLRRGELDPATRLVVVGSQGPETPALHALVRHFSLEKNVAFFDNLPDAELLWLYRNCELAISPSRTEGFSLPVAEAMFSGARIVCSDIPAHREIAGDTAEYFNPDSPQAEEQLASAVMAAMAAPAQRVQKLPDRFVPCHVGHQYIELYRTLLSSSSSGGPMSNPVIHRTASQANVLGVGIHATDMDGAASTIHTALQSGTRGYVCLAGVHGVMQAQKYPDLRSIYADALLVAPDGTPTVWVGRLQGHRSMKRVFGPDLMWEILSRPEFHNCTHFLCGGDPGVAEDLREKLQQRLPHLKIVGIYMPPFRAMTLEEEQHLQAIVQAVKPDIMWVGLSTPLQERFMAEQIGKLDVQLMFGVGAAFNYHTGRLIDSPDWVKTIGMQWFHRLLQEPGRLWKRYLVNNSLFILRIALQGIGLGRPLPQQPAQSQAFLTVPGQRSV